MSSTHPSSFASEKRNVLLLCGAQALFQTVSILVVTLSSVVGRQLAENKALATLPMAMMMIAAASVMVPASMMMQRFGRKAGFLLGIFFGMLAGVAGALSLWLRHFGLFVVANMLVGAYQGFAQYYRFAAADAASPPFRSRAISWVVAGGIVAAFAGPNLARVTKDISAIPFLYSFFALVALGALAALCIALTSIPPAAKTNNSGSAGRPLLHIMRQPVFITAVTGSAVGYAIMVMVMAATPLAMQMHGHSPGATATVIQWHVLGMFAPSFFTGDLIRRLGVLRIMGAGVLMMLLHMSTVLAGTSFAHFLLGLTFVGIGWNFLFIGGTSLLTEAYRPEERAKTQAAHDFITFGVVSIATFSGGALLNAWNWTSFNLTTLPLLALALMAIAYLAQSRR